MFTLSIVILQLVNSKSTMASLSVLTEGNPREYELSLNKSSTYQVGKEVSPLRMKEVLLKFEGADLKEGRFVFEDRSPFSSLTFNKAQIKVEDGTFFCSGILMKNDKEMPLDFNLSLEPIKNGFELKAKILKGELFFDLILKKK